MSAAKSKALTKEQIEFLVKHQLSEQKNYEIRPKSEIIKEIPMKCFKNFAITTTFGATMTAAISGFSFRKMEPVKKDLAAALPVLGMFSAVDFSINYTLTKALGLKNPTRAVCVTSGTCAGATCGWYFSGHQWKPTVFGGVAGGIYGALRNSPVEMLGFEPF